MTDTEITNRQRLIVFYSRVDRPLWHRFWIELFGGGRTSHLAVSNGVVVMERFWDRCIFWPFMTYMRRGAWHGYHTFECDEEVDLSDFAPTNKVEHLELWKKLVGLKRKDGDCVDVIRDCLRHIGVDVPQRIITPNGMRKWIQKSGIYHTGCLLNPRISLESWTKLSQDQT